MLDSIYKDYSLIEENGEQEIIYLDFIKAFDSVPNKRLTSTLQSYDITGKSLSVILYAFLSHRKFAVKIGDTASRSFKVKSVVPQGTILGPLSFPL